MRHFRVTAYLHFRIICTFISITSLSSYEVSEIDIILWFNKLSNSPGVTQMLHDQSQLHIIHIFPLLRTNRVSLLRCDGYSNEQDSVFLHIVLAYAHIFPSSLTVAGMS